MSFVSNWKQQGIISLWRYEYPDDIHYPNWHLTADEVGCVSLMLLLKAFEKDQQENFRTIKITAPDDAILGVPNNRVGRAKWQAPTEWHISYSKKSDEWSFSDQTEPAQLIIGKNWFGELKWAFDGIIVGEGDSWIGDSAGKEELLWYWRYPQLKK